MNRLGRFIPAIILLVALFSAGGYLVWAYVGGGSGFPLDDAWIHQTYARNLAETGQLAYMPGQPSAGSTSPAWSYLLSVSYLIGIDPLLWAYLLGALALAASAWLVYRLCLRLLALQPGALVGSESGSGPSSTRSTRTAAAVLAGLFCAVEWHLVWASGSGMETMLFIALSLGLIEYLFLHIANRQEAEGPASLRMERTIVSAVGIGLLSGALVLTRPEGLGLVALVLAGMVLLPRPPAREEVRSRLVALAVALVGCGLLVGPYIAFNLETSGSVFPNTFYAKQAEYNLDLPLLQRFWRVLSPTLVGAQVLLLPGFVYAAYRVLRQRLWLAALPLAWWFGFLVVYALRLPVNYQHGRYAIPTIPILILYGVWGTSLVLRPRSPNLLARVTSRATPVAVALLALYFWVIGAQAYRDDVGFIEGEMVTTAHWLTEHTAPGDLIAVHDIGAVGYFTERELLDLAGLITPEVIPFMTDAEELLDWMLDQKAVYTVFFPDFSPTYEQMAAEPQLEVIFCTGYGWTREQGKENMCAYRLQANEQP